MSGMRGKPEAQKRKEKKATITITILCEAGDDGEMHCWSKLPT